MIARRPAGRKSPEAIAPELEQPALVAVRQWEYEPTIVEGKAVPVILRESVMFREFVNPTVATREPTTRGLQTPVAAFQKGPLASPEIGQPASTCRGRPRM